LKKREDKNRMENPEGIGGKVKEKTKRKAERAERSTEMLIERRKKGVGRVTSFG